MFLFCNVFNQFLHIKLRNICSWIVCLTFVLSFSCYLVPLLHKVLHCLSWNCSMWHGFALSLTLLSHFPHHNPPNIFSIPIFSLYSTLVHRGCTWIMFFSTWVPSQETWTFLSESNTVTKMVNKLEHLSYNKMLRGLGLFSLKKRKRMGPLPTCINASWEGHDRWWWTQNTLNPTCKLKSTFLLWRQSETNTGCPERLYVISVLRDVQILTGQFWTASSNPVLSKGLDYRSSRDAFSPINWIYDPITCSSSLY